MENSIKTFNQIRSTRFFFDLTLLYLVVAIAIAVNGWALHFSTPLFIATLLVSLPLIASRQHALMILTHDGVHYRALKGRGVNDFLTRMLVAFPAFISLSKWRYIHLSHHRYTYSKKDPDRLIFNKYPIAGQSFTKQLLRDFLGLNVVRMQKYFLDLPFISRKFNERFLGKKGSQKYAENTDMKQFYLFWAVIFTIGTVFGGGTFWFYFLLFWVLPFATFYQVFVRIRGILEHAVVDDRKNELLQTRTFLMPTFLRFFLAPMNVNFHIEHHLYPGVPYYNLPALHHFLKAGKYKGEKVNIENFGPVLARAVT